MPPHRCHFMLFFMKQGGEGVSLYSFGIQGRKAGRGPTKAESKGTKCGVNLWA